MIESVGEFMRLYETSENAKEWRFESLSSAVWRELLERGFPKEVLLLHKHIPVEVLGVLAQDPDPNIRSMVADKRAAAPLLPSLAHDQEPRVRLRVVFNGKATPDLLAELCLDADPEIAAEAKSRLGLIQQAPSLPTGVKEPKYE
jgi:hypothetical protein